MSTAPGAAATTPTIASPATERRRSRRSTWLIAVPLLPAAASLASAWAQGWVPVADGAVAAIRSIDVGRGHLTLLGLPASISEFSSGPQRYHPGPLMFWVLAPFTTLFGAQLGTAVGAVTVNTAAGMGAIAAADRGAKPRLTFATTIAVLIVGATVWGPGHLYDPFNTMFPALAFFCVLVLAWRVTCGDAAMLPWAVLASSFCIQTHVVWALPSLAVLGPAAIVAFGPTRWRLSDRPRPTRRQTVTTVVVALALWSFPLADALLHEGGNLRLLASGTEGASILGIRGAWATVLRLFDLPPVSLMAISDSTFLRATNVSLVLGIAGAAWSVRHALRTGDGELRRLLAVAALSAVGAAATTALLPDAGLEGGQMTFFKVVAPFVWLALIVPWLQTWQPAPGRARLVRAMAICSLTVVAVLSCLPFPLRNSFDPDGWLYDAEPELEQQLARALPADRPYRLEATGGRRYLLLLYGLVAGLDDRGWTVGVTEARSTNYGANRVMEDRPGLVTLHLQDPSMDPPAGATLVASFRSEVDEAARLRLEEELLERARDHGSIVLTPEGHNQLEAALLGRPGIGEAEIRSLRQDPTELLEHSPELLAVLYRNDWIAEPSLPGSLWSDYVRLLGPADVDIWATTGG